MMPGTKTTLVLALSLAACSSGDDTPNATAPPETPGGPLPAAEVRIEWSGRAVLWGEPTPLRASLTGIPNAATIEWRSLDDLYQGTPVVLGTGTEITTSALKPGRTTVEVVAVSNGVEIARDGVAVEVVYRERWNVALEAHHAFPPFTVGDIWTENGHALVARRAEGGISILAIDNGLEEVSRFDQPELFTQDVKAADGFAYVSNESKSHPHSVVVVDIRDPRAPVAVGSVDRRVTASAHNIWVEGAILYIAASRDKQIHVYDVSEPVRPRLLRIVSSVNGTAHDVHVRDGLVYGSYLPLGTDEVGQLVVSVDDGGSIAATRTWAGAFTHSAWLSADGRYLYVLDEVVNAPVRIFDVSNPAAPALVGHYQPRVGTIPHQFQVVDGTRAYLANYQHGVEVVDISDPLRPRLIGFYDTFPGAQAFVGFSSGAFNISSTQALGRDLCEERCLSMAHGMTAQSVFNGAWGVHWTGDDRFVVADMASGVFLLRYSPDS